MIRANQGVLVIKEITEKALKGSEKQQRITSMTSC